MKWISTRGRKVWNYAGASGPILLLPPSLLTPWYTSRNGYSTRWPVVTRLSRKAFEEIELNIRLASDSRGWQPLPSASPSRGFNRCPTNVQEDRSNNFNTIEIRSNFLIYSISFVNNRSKIRFYLRFKIYNRIIWQFYLEFILKCIIHFA